MTDPLDAQIVELARAYVLMHHLPLTALQVQKLGEIAKVVWNDLAEPCQLLSSHKYLYDGQPGAGEYRTTSLIGVSGGFRDYPRPTLIPQLMVRVYGSMYRNCLSGAVEPEMFDVAEIAWCAGATLRAIHPFGAGQLPLSWVIEMQLRLRFGLPPTLEMRSKLVFDSFRRQEFAKLVSGIMG